MDGRQTDEGIVHGLMDKQIDGWMVDKHVEINRCMHDGSLGGFMFVGVNRYMDR